MVSTEGLPPQVSELSEALPPVLSSEGVLLYGVSGVIALILIANVVNWWRDRQREDVELGELLEDETLEAAEAEWAVLDDLSERQQDLMAPAAITWETRAARVGEQWTTTLYVAEYPDAPKDGYLSGLFELTDVEFDLTSRIVPKNQPRARDELQRVADNLQADARLERSVRGSYLQERANRAEATYKAVENGQKVFDKELVITVRADTRDELSQAVKRVRATLREQPARVEPKTAICTQDLALQSAAPIGPSELDRSAVALGGAVGALLASPHNATILEEGGVEFGIHKDTRSPLVIDPFGREDGYAMFTVGDPGSGKSFGAKQNFIRSIEQDPDRIGVILEPLNNWAGVAEALGGRRITVGGMLGLNPLEIKPTPEHVLNARGDDASLLKERRNRAVSFFTNFFGHRDVELGDRRTTLELAIDEAYDRKGITEDVSTHDRESPTVRDVLDILESMNENPEEYVVRVEAESEKIQSDVVWLLDQLRPFEENGQLENLGRHSEFDIRDEDIVYLDLQQQGGSIGGHTSLLMELLITLVYERAKTTDKSVVLVVDEARYILSDSATLEYLETIFRHHRHHDLSIRLVTQTVDEFFQQPQAEMILDQCAIKQFHKLDGMDEQWADEFGLNYAQMRFVQDAIPGSDEKGYSQALLGIDGEWRGMEVRALPTEKAVIDYEPQSNQSVEESLQSDEFRTEGKDAATGDD
ncbi:transferase [Natronomonas gomsonensis]|uniref:VirB4 family type IV secretion system protein n=1 Tax=Natronomonas gomsonensis TaxID=1046043 RepID=UPI0020CA8B70|nr:transferase [Natronomonas gomsonensis]MCY4732327.1 transferase [Natronomonas gomsonensis]